MTERLTKCPLCQSGLFINHSEIKDFSVSKEVFKLCQCKTCGLVFTNPRPSQDAIDRYYQFEDYISHQDKATNLTNFLYKQVRRITLKTKINWIETFSETKGKILDYGCGTGYFLQEAKKSGWDTFGVEPSQQARKNAIKFDLKIAESIDHLDSNITFDTITLFHVLEHIHELKKISEKLISKLSKSGTILIAVPNRNSYDAEYYQEHWAAWDVPRHLYHFNRESMLQFAEEMNLKLIGERPMKFDSYYVSLLSEQHKGKQGLNALINGFYKGLKSNIWAKTNGSNYSSILFILKKK